MTVSEVECVFWAVDWDWSGPRTNPYVKFLLVLCVCWWCGQTGGGALERVQIFILGTKKLIFLALSGRESSLVQTFCESWVHLDITHPSIHMTRSFVIQGCPTLNRALTHGLVSMMNNVLEGSEFASCMAWMSASSSLLFLVDRSTRGWLLRVMAACVTGCS